MNNAYSTAKPPVRAAEFKRGKLICFAPPFVPRTGFLPWKGKSFMYKRLHLQVSILCPFPLQA